MAEMKVRLPALYPAQKKILARSSRFNVVCMGEQAGKTTLGIEVLLASKRGALSLPRGQSAAWFSKSTQKLDDVRRLVKRAIDPVIKRQVNSRRLELVTGSFIDFYAFDDLPTNLPQYALAVFDDVSACHDFLRVYDDTLSELLREHNGTAWFLSGAFGKKNDFYRLYRRGMDDEDWSCWQVPTDANPHISEETRRLMEVTQEPEFSQRFGAEFLEVAVEMSASHLLIGYDESFREWCVRLAAEGLKVDGKPFSLEDRPALMPLYDAIPTYREDAKDQILVIQKATQLGATVWEVLANIYMAIKWGPVSIGMYMPAQTTAIHKSEHRFMRIVRSSPQLYDILTVGTGVDGKEKKVGEGNVLTRRVKDSLLLFLWTTGKVTTESVPLDVVSLDEVQEMTLEQMDKVRARTGDSEISFTLMLSTANIDDADINFWYRQGSQEVWHTECPHCKALSDLSDPAGIFPEKSIGYSNGDVPGVPQHEYFWRCPACEGVIENPQIGRYIVTNPGAPSNIRSLLLPRTISPKLTPRKMIEAWMRAKTGDQKKSFYNRTLARPYIDADQLPVSMSHCLAAAEAGMRLGLKWKTTGRSTYCGIDQMGGFNAVIIKERMPDGRQAVVHVEAVFDLDPFERCAQMMDQFNVAVCVVEQLPNVNDARKFANRFPGRVFLAGYADLRDDQMQWGDQLSRSDARTSEEDRSRFTVTLNQYKCMQTALYRIKDGHCLFPNPDDLEQEVIENGRRKKIVITRDWVFFHFTKTALVVEQKEDERKHRAKVVKIGIDPHFSYANMLCDVAWARAHGTSTFLLPDVGTTKPKQLLDPQAIEAPAPLQAYVEQLEIVRGDVCGRCVSFDAATGTCNEIGMGVKPGDPGCWRFISG